MVAVLAVATVVLLAALRSSDEGESAVPLPDANVAWPQIAAEVPPDPGRRYSDEELGLYELIDEVISNTPSYIRFRTVEEWIAFENEKRERIDALESGHERERLAFESKIETAIHSAYGSLPSDIGVGGRLEIAFIEAMRECAAEAGYPDINPAGGSDEEESHWEAEFGLTPDGLLDLRHECAQRAASYPTLSPDARDEMLNRIRKHYLQAVHNYIRDFDVVEVPVDYHEGASRPLEESFIELCLEHEVAVRAACAEHYRIVLTEEQMTAPVPEQLGPYPLIGQPCGFDADIPGYVYIDDEGGYCDRFENLEFVINYPETAESREHVPRFGLDRERLLRCPLGWILDDERKCRYPHPEHAAVREALLAEKYPDLARMPLYSSFYDDKD